MIDKSDLVKGAQFQVVANDAYLRGHKPSGPNCETSVQINLRPGDTIEYTGLKYTGGCDGIEAHAFRFLGDHEDARYAFMFRPTETDHWCDTVPSLQMLATLP